MCIRIWNKYEGIELTIKTQSFSQLVSAMTGGIQYTLFNYQQLCVLA